MIGVTIASIMRCAFLGHIYVGLSPTIPVKVVGFCLFGFGFFVGGLMAFCNG